MKRQLLQKSIICASIGTALVFWQPAISLAEEMQPEYSLDQVVITANRVPTTVAKAAADVTVITRDEIERGNYTSLTEVLKHANGAIVTQQGFPGGEEYIWLNGDERVLILVDGRRMNLGKLAGHTRATYDVNSFPAIDNIERIEIVKGAASALYGTDAVGGVVNIITRKGGESRSSLTVGAGSWGNRIYTFATEGSENSLKWIFTGGRKQQERYAYKQFQTGQVKDMPNSAYDQNYLTFRLDKELDASSSLIFSVAHAGDHKGQPGGAPAIYPYFNSRAYLDTLTNSWDLTYNMKKDTGTPAYLKVYQNYYKYGTQQSGDDSDYNNKETGFSWQTGWNFGSANTLVGGVEWRDIAVEYDGFYTEKIMTNKAVYLEDNMKLGNKWTFTPGMRYDHYSMFGSKMTPRAALNYQADKTANIFFSWGRVFNAPTADDLYWPSQYGGYMIGNPNLKPETGHTATLGMSKQLDAQSSITVSGFQSELHDAIAWDDARGYWTPSNIDEAKKRGAAVEWRHKLSPVWGVMAGYSYLKVEKKTGSAYVPDTANARPNGYRLGAGYTQDRWKMDIDVTGVSGLSTEKFTSSSYWVIDLSANYAINPNTRIYLKGNNITNRAYEVYGSSYIGAYPMAARSYQFGVNYSF